MSPIECVGNGKHSFESCTWHIVVNALNDIMPCAGKCVNDNMPYADLSNTTFVRVGGGLMVFVNIMISMLFNALIICQ